MAKHIHDPVSVQWDFDQHKELKITFDGAANGIQHY